MTLAKLNIIVIAVVVSGTAAFAFFVMVPGFQEIRKCEELIAADSAAVERKQKEVGKISDLYGSILDLERKRTTFEERLPSEQRRAEFQNTVSDCLIKQSIKDYEMQTKDELELDSKELPESLQITREAALLPLSVQFEGASYENIFAFLAQIESLPRLAHIESLDLINSETQPGKVKVNMQMHTYRRRGELVSQ